jgi:site-specific DNA-methyltransferase (adenine-specific)
VSVKSGGVNSSQVRDLKGVLEREKAEIGIFITLEEPSAPMQLEATTAGVYHSDLSGKDYQRVQIYTIRDLLEHGRKPDLPVLVLGAYQQAPKVQKREGEQGELFG